MTQVDVSFPMYNLPEMAPAYQALWDALVDELQKEGVTGLPTALNFRRPPVPDTIGPEVFFSQTCGYPLQTIFSGQYELLGVPTYDAPARQAPDPRHRAGGPGGLSPHSRLRARSGSAGLP